MHHIHLIFVSILLISCTKEPSNENELICVESGTRFGFCVGYCAHEVKVTLQKTSYVKSGTRVDTLPEVRCELQTEPDVWESIESMVDDAFFALDSIIGCPDCVDQGAEFISVITPSRSYTVTFDPTIEKSIHPLVERLRALREAVIDSDACK